MPVEYDHDHENEINYFGMANFRNKMRNFGIKTDDRRRHTYIIGKTGMGKTTVLENMIINDINAGHGLGIVDPHGDMAEKILDFIPAHRINDVVVFNPSDYEYPVAFNVLETVNPLHKHLVSQGLMGVFKKIWPDVWSARMEHILNNCLLALLDFPGSTLLGINRLLVDKAFRKRVISKIKDPIVRAFWIDEFQVWEGKFRTEAIQPIQNKVGQFLSASMIRNIVAQVKSTINPREIMDSGKILIMNLAKGRLGEDTSRLLGGMLITKMQLAAMERVDTPEKDRRDFYLYVDEFQNFATDSFANILSEARKYRLDLTIAHQYIGQLVNETSTRVRDAVFGNVGTIIMFRVGADDAEFLARETEPTFMAEDLVNLPKYEIYLRLMIDGVTSIPFSATTMNPIAVFEGNREKIIRVSRERHARPVAEVEAKVMRWAGDEYDEDGNEEVSVSAGEPLKSLENTGTMRASLQHVRGEQEREREEPSGVAPAIKRPPVVVPAPAPLQDTVPAVRFDPEVKAITLQEAMQQKPLKIKLAASPRAVPQPGPQTAKPQGGVMPLQKSSPAPIGSPRPQGQQVQQSQGGQNSQKGPTPAAQPQPILVKQPSQGSSPQPKQPQQSPAPQPHREEADDGTMAQKVSIPIRSRTQK